MCEVSWNGAFGDGSVTLNGHAFELKEADVRLILRHTSVDIHRTGLSLAVSSDR